MGNYIKHGTGPNDWKKGNRKTKAEGRKPSYTGPVNAAFLAAGPENGRKAAEEVDKYKQIAAEKARANRYGQEYALELLNRLTEYIENQQAAKKPITIGGLVRASGMNVDTFQRYRKGEADYMLYKFMDKHGIPYEEEGTLYTLPGSEGKEGQTVLLSRLSDVVKLALLTVQEQLEGNCYTNKGNPAGSIFGLKASFGWQDQPQEHKSTHNNTLVLNNVATLEEAKEALRLLSE